MDVREVALGILKREEPIHMAYRVADSSIWKVDGGPSIAESFNRFGVVFKPSAKGPGSRHNGYIETRNRIAGNEEGPMLFATENCHAGFWRTIPDLVLDEHRLSSKEDAVDTDQEDHCGDDVTYACMSRPWQRHSEKKEEKVEDWLKIDEEEKELEWRVV